MFFFIIWPGGTHPISSLKVGPWPISLINILPYIRSPNMMTNILWISSQIITGEIQPFIKSWGINSSNYQELLLLGNYLSSNQCWPIERHPLWETFLSGLEFTIPVQCPSLTNFHHYVLGQTLANIVQSCPMQKPLPNLGQMSNILRLVIALVWLVILFIVLSVTYVK